MLIRDGANQSIRKAMRIDAITYEQIASVLGVHKQTVYNWFCREFTDEQREQITKAIETIKSKNNRRGRK